MSPRLRDVRPGTRVTALGAAAIVVLGLLSAPADAAPAVHPAALAPAPATPLTESQALAQAQATGTAVAVASATTPTETLTADPDGQLTLTRTAMPARRFVDGQWRDLDATLHRNPDGSITPAVVSSDMSLSGGGSGPLATLAGSGHRLALSMPMALPAPTLDGSVATYHDVLPDVDLVATADEQGGFSEVVVVRTAAGAADPRLAKLTLATQATGLTLRSDEAGNIRGVDKLGRVVVAAPAPQMWDSSTASATTGATSRARKASPVGAEAPAVSSPDGPGVNAKRAPLSVQATASAITLTPDKSLMAAPGLSYPVYLDPSFVQPTVADNYNGWATINKRFASTNYWDSTPDPHPAKNMQVGMSPDDSGFVSRSLINFPIEVSKFGAAANISSASLKINEQWSYSCSARVVDLYTPASTLTSANATWNSWSGVSLGGVVDSLNVAYGYDGCGPKDVAFDVLTAVRSAVTAKKTKETFLLKAASETDEFAWKEFAHPSSSIGPTLTVNFNHPPATPAALKTNPASTCSGSAIGLGPVSLSATVSDADGGTVGATFTVTNSTTKAVVQHSDPQVTHATSGQTVSYALDQSLLAKSAAGKVTTFDWTATATDYKATSGAATCHFTFDPTTPGAPNVTLPPDGVTIGQTVSFTASPSGTDQPGAYLVQLNGDAPVRYAATAGVATFSVTPTRLANSLTVAGVSATGTNIGQPSDQIFNAQPSGVASADQDLTGDGVPDLLAAGGPGTALPSGLWVSPGDRVGGIDPSPADVGLRGDGLTGDNLPADFNGARAISGRFNPGADGLQDILIYQPQGAVLNEGGGEVLDGNGDGSPIDPTSGRQHTINAGTLDDQFDYTTSVAPQQLVNAGTSTGHAYPDLLGIGGDADQGYSPWFYSGTFQPGVFDGPTPMLGLTTPTGGTDWNTWTLASAQVGGQADVFLWQRSTGALYLWSDLAYDGDASTLDYTTSALGTWNAGASLSLQAADIDNDGTPDLWALDATAKVTTWLVTDVTPGGTGTIAAQPPQTLNTPAHSWPLSDAEEGTATTARDYTGALDTTATSGSPTFSTGDMFSPDVIFTAAHADTLSTSTAAVNTAGDFTISLWTKPNAYSGNVLSQDSKNGTLFKIWPSSDTTWKFAFQKADTVFTSATWDTASSAAGTAKLGFWYHITVSYQASTKRMQLYINDIAAGSAVRSSTWTYAQTKLLLGSMRTSPTATDWYYDGQLADVQTFNRVIPPMLLANWDMNAGSGTTIADKSGFANTATLAGGYTWTTDHTTTQNGAITFNGTTGYAVTAGPLTQPASTSFSLTAWVYLTDATASTDRVLISQPGSNRSPFYLNYGKSTNSWQFLFSNANVPTDPVLYTAADPNPAARNTWVHLAGTYEATTHTAHLYVNGTLVATTTGITTWDSTGGVFIGRSGATWWQGKLDAVRVYQGVLTDSEVKDIMTSS